MYFLATFSNNLADILLQKFNNYFEYKVVVSLLILFLNMDAYVFPQSDFSILNNSSDNIL